MIREVIGPGEIKTAEFVYRNMGPAMEHNYLCAVCRDKKAIIELWHGILQPCWDCQARGWKLIKKWRFWK